MVYGGAIDELLLGRILKGRMFWLSVFIMLVIVIAQYIAMFVTTKGFNDAGIIKVFHIYLTFYILIDYHFIVNFIYLYFL